MLRSTEKEPFKFGNRLGFAIVITGMIFLVGCRPKERGEVGQADSVRKASIDQRIPESCVLKLSPKEGEKYLYKLVMGDGKKAQATFFFSMAAEKVADERVTFLTALEGGEIQGQALGREVIDEIKKSKNRTVMSSDGRHIESTTDNLASSQNGPNITFGVSFPSGPVKAGDQWEGTSMNEGKEIQVRNKLVSFALIDGVQVAVVEVNAIGDLGLSVEQVGPAEMMIDLSTGMIFRYKMSIKSKEEGGRAQAFVVNMARV